MFIKNIKLTSLKKLLLITIFITSFVYSQNKSLFWEISGNGLAKKSYLYGTMHVNERVSFHLSDSFFNNLLASDIVANESNPETWSDLNDIIKNNETNYNRYNKLYSEFYLFPVSKENIKSIFENDNEKYFRNMLSGVEGNQADFQENTVLDMFIFQTGKKYKKKIAGLEDAKQSMISILNIMDKDAMPKDENKIPLMKILKNRNLDEVLKEYYREKDIVMLDSIYKLIFSKKAHDALIINRNKVMTRSIDSIAKTGSLFSAVGAAHLAGSEGIIELLRKKGYTVNPIIDVFTEAGKNKKKTIEAYFPNPTFSAASTRDKMIQLPLYKAVIEEKQNLGSPDFTNGAAITIKRMPLNYFLKNNETAYNAKSLDSLFFEKIAGDILEKKYFEQASYSGYDIKNVTKTGNAQHSKFIVTPLEIISILMTGPANYVRQYENDVFENIKVKSFKNEWEKIKPLKGGFETEIPSFNLVFGNIPEKGNDIEIQAYDNQEKGYYFLKEKTLSNTDVLEDSEYEQKQIHFQFYLQQDQDSTNVRYNKAENTLVSSSKIGNRNMKLKSVISGSKYYLLGTVNASETNTNRFFNSFTIAPFTYKAKTRVYTDSTANYKVEIPEKENESLFWNLKKTDTDSKNTFTETYKFQSFNSETGDKIGLVYYKYPKYEHTLSIDSIQKNLKKDFLKQSAQDYVNNDFDDNYYFTPTSLLNSAVYSKIGFSKSNWNNLLADKKNNYDFLSYTTKYDKTNECYVIDALVSKQSSTQAVKYRVLYKNNAYCTLSALVDKNYKNENPFIEKTFNSLVLLQDNKTESEDKITLFMEDAGSKSDTIRSSALHAVHNLDITPNDFEKVTNFINTFNFKESETYVKTALIEKIGELKDERVIPFLENYYKKENTKTEVQVSILRALSKQKSKAAYKKINELLDYDLPIPDNQFDIRMLFSAFESDAENSKELFPEIFQYYSIKEYQNPVISFSNLLLEKKLISIKKLKTFKKIIVTNTKLEYKRALSWNQKNKPAEDETDSEEVKSVYLNNYSESFSDLVNYTTLVYNYADDSAVKDLLKKIKKLDNLAVNTELVRLGITHNNLTDSEINDYLKDPKTQFATINLLLNNNKKDLVNFSDEEISKAAVINFQNLVSKDSINLLNKKIIEKNGQQISLFFCKIKKKNAEAGSLKSPLYTIGFINKNGKIDPLAYTIINSKQVNDDEEILEKKYDLIVSEFLNAEHLRASFSKQKDEEESFYDEEY